MADESAALAGSRPMPVASTFEVGSHVVRVVKVMEGRWSVGVDATPLNYTYATQAEAWEAGVREADRLDRAQPRTAIA